jgi:signal transduction histidine kinase
LNALLKERENAVQRALATAGDLAHGLKTPLAVLRHDAGRAQLAGHVELAEAIDRQVERMSRQVEYHLTRARAAASGAKGATPCPLATSAEAVARTVLKLHADRDLAFDSDVDPAISVRVQLEDLEEMLGNLIDNACKWARSRVVVSATQTGSTTFVVIDDDGPGIPEPNRSVALGRGVRLDEAAPGSGLGLAIVRDLVDTYGGAIALDDSPAGGLRVRLTLPSGPLAPAAE